MTVKLITSLEEFNELIASNKLVAIDFYATWCGPCRMISPRFEELSKEFTAVVFIKVDVDQAAKIAERMEITAMPTFMFFKDGKKVGTVVGADPNQLRTELQKLA